MLTAAGPVAAGAAHSGTGSFDDEGDGGNLAIAGGATTVGHADAADDFTAAVANFINGTNTSIAGSDVEIRAVAVAVHGNQCRSTPWRDSIFEYVQKMGDGDAE